MAESVLSAAQFHEEAAALAFIEVRLWPNGPICPRCGEAARVGRMNGKSTKLGQCKCYVCRKPFAVTVGTVMESSHIPLCVWLQAMHLLGSSKKGISSHQLHRTLGCTLKSAWFLSHRIREAMRDLHLEPMGGAGMTIEADETFIGQKPGVKKGRGYAHKHVVLALVEREGKVRSFHVPNVTADSLRPIIAKHAHTDSRFQTDEMRTYIQIGQTFAYHGVVNHGAKEYVRGTDSTNTIEGYFSIVKRGLYGIYQHVSEAHLHRYMAEFDFRYSNRVALGVDDKARTDLTILGTRGKRLTYRTTRGSRTAEAAEAPEGLA